jgi:hypothetical protein
LSLEEAGERMRLGTRAARTVAAIQEEARRETYSVRLVAIGLFELGTLAAFPLLRLSHSTGALVAIFVVVSATAVSLVLLARVLVRGTGLERFLALLLCPFPLIVWGLGLSSVILGLR